MGETTKIQWTDHTFNPWVGCQKVSDLCKNCYAEVSTFTRAQRGRGRELWGPDSIRHRTSESNWKEPLLWDREALAADVRARVFCASLADIFEDRRDLDPWREDLWRLILSTTRLDWQLLTKRPQNVLRLAPAVVLEKVWIGYSGIDATGIDELMRIPSLVRFLSLEPLLQPVDLAHFLPVPIACRRSVSKPMSEGDVTILRDMMRQLLELDGRYPIDWVIVGGESGKSARPCETEWVRSIVEVCQVTRTPVFVKQLGAHALGSMLIPTSRRMELNHPKGGDPAEWPADLRHREFPAP